MGSFLLSPGSTTLAFIILLLLFILTASAFVYWPKPAPPPQPTPNPPNNDNDVVFKTCRIEFVSSADANGKPMKNSWNLVFIMEGDKPPGWAKGMQVSLLTKYKEIVLAAPGGPCGPVHMRVDFGTRKCLVDKETDKLTCTNRGLPLTDQLVFSASPPPAFKGAQCCYVALEGIYSQLTYNQEFYVKLELYNMFGEVRSSTAKLFPSQIPKKQ